MTALKKTPLYKAHHALKAKMMGFAGWELPVWFTSILGEHRAVRTQAGIFDVSHMGRIWVTGSGAGDLLDRVLTRPVSNLKTGNSRLCLMCLEDGGILDDLLVYHVETDKYLVVWNAGNTAQKLDWLKQWSDSEADVTITNISSDTVMLSVQGPGTSGLYTLKSLSGLPRFNHTRAKIGEAGALVARTGYTGEDGFEIVSDTVNALYLWNMFLEEGIEPCGLGARDILRLEAGLLLYGQDMDVNTSPFEAGLDRFIDLDRDDFAGRTALLEMKRQDINRKLIGFRMQGREIPRSGYKIFKSGVEVGKVTSGGYSPALGFGIGLGYVPVELSYPGTDIDIIIRNKRTPAGIIVRPFYKRGELYESGKLPVHRKA